MVRFDQSSAMMMLGISLLLISVTAQASSNNWPIIGVFTQPTDSLEGDCNGNCLYLAASYVKYLESAGARVVPINYYANKKELDNVFNSVNGIFFPGGDADFPESAQYIFDKVVAANDAGDFMPLWGTCMGFEWLLMSATRDASVLDPKSSQMDAYNYSIPLDFTSAAAGSKLFKDASPDVMDILTKQNVTMNNHHYGIWTEHFHAEPKLNSFFEVLSTNNDRAGSNFVSTIESFKYPIFGSQWHPEKNGFEWGKTNGIPNEAINHSPEAVKIAQYTSNFFVQQACQNNHKFPSAAEEDAALIYNYTPAKTTGSFVQEYHFHF